MKIVKPDAVSTTGRVTRAGVATYYDSNGYLQTSSSGALRFGYDPSTLEFIGLILEEARSNLLLQSSAFEAVNWTKSNIDTIAVNTEIAPTNTLIAEKIVPTSTLGSHTITQENSSPTAIGQTYTFSVFAKSSGYDWIRLQFDGAAGEGAYCFFNLSDASIGASSGINNPAVVEKLKNNWVRISISKKAAAGPLSVSLYVQSSDNQLGSWSADNTSGVLLYGAQLEIGRTMSSYISTTTAQATRAAEVITGDGLLYTSVTNPYSEWSSATTYSLGQIVVVGTYTGSNTVNVVSSGTYKSLTNSNTNNNPLNSPNSWVRIGPTNQFAMFDNMVSSSTSSTTEFTFVIKSMSVDTIALLNVLANKLIIALSDYSYSQDYPSNVVFHRTLQLAGTESIDWFSYFLFDTDTQKTQGIFTNLPQVSDGVITVRVTGTGAVSAGSFIDGKVKEIGGTQYGVNTGIVDYSKKTTDEYGNTTLVVGNYSKRMNAKVFLDNKDLNRVQRLLYNIRATPVLWLASDDPDLEEPLIVLGYYKDFDTEIAYPAHSLCNLTVEGLI